MKFQSIKKYLKNNDSKLKLQQSFRREVDNIFTEKVNKIVFSANDGKIMQILIK